MEEQQNEFASLSEDFCRWTKKFGFTGLMKEFYNNTYEQGFREDDEAKNFKQMKLGSLMEIYNINKDDIIEWSSKQDIGWLLEDELLSDKDKKHEDFTINLKVRDNSKFQNINVEERVSFFNKEVSRFICFCLEMLFSATDDRDHIKNKIVRQRLFYLEPGMKTEKKKRILSGTTVNLDTIMKKAKAINTFTSIYYKNSISKAARGIYVSDYGGRLLRWVVIKDKDFVDDGYFICPNMEPPSSECTNNNFWLGFAASLVPMIHHNAGPRGVFMANMMKQSLEPELEGKVWLKHDDPIILTLTSKALRREKHGLNLLVKWASHRGYNIEDGIVANKRMEDLIGGRVSTRSVLNLEDNEYYLPISQNWKDRIEEYDLDGVIKVGSKVKDGQILASKIRVDDNSLIEKIFVKAIIDNESTVTNVEKFENRVIVTTGYSYSLKVGDKMVSSAAQKGVITYFLDDKDEPADIIINPCCIPSRMTLAQIWEGVISNYWINNKM
ncbi:hypothetical protein EDC05_005980, partial [Coemansia umbellata]